ncbi:MAG: substrate-binding domain-containing protein [Actinobacteria bacterium]|jgi:simple sugar transport system substrate-binding protein|nr:substrate-binding domain-containing protein [Actinomycetota bacterium]
MKIRKTWGVVLGASALLALAACGGSSDSSTESEEATAEDSAEVTAGEDITIAVITHGDDGVFWSVAQKGAEAAGAALGITMNYQGANNNAQDQAQMIEQAVTDGVDGIAVSLADPKALEGALKKVVEAGIPLITLNSGSDLFKGLGAITHVGQDETIAGNGAGERLKAAGGTVLLCAKQEQSNVALEERCNAAEKTFGGKVIQITTSGDADRVAQQAEIKAAMDADPSINAFLGTGPVIAVDGANAAAELGRSMPMGGFDLSTEILDYIGQDKLTFTIDQQQFLQGYLAVVFLYLNVTNKNTVGGGLPVMTGPGFVDKSNVVAVQELVGKGTR